MRRWLTVLQGKLKFWRALSEQEQERLVQDQNQARVGQIYFGRYEFVKFVRDGMGLVYRAIDHNNNKSVNVAIKILTKPNDQDLNERFNREIRIYHEIRLSSIARHHESNMKGIDFERGTKVKYLVTLWEGDKTVSNLIEDAAQISSFNLLNICVNIARQLAVPLDYLHQGKVQDYFYINPENNEKIIRIVHRDIKPSNIVFKVADESANKAQFYLKAKPVLIDFGIAKELTGTGDEQTHIGDVPKKLGTYTYMSPEQWDPWNKIVDGRSDQYSLALTIYHILSNGKSPFDPDFSGHPPKTESTTQAWWEYQHTSRDRNDLTPIQKYREDIPKPVWDVIKKAISVNQTDRYASIAEFTKALDHAAFQDASWTHTDDASIVPTVPSSSAPLPHSPTVTPPPVSPPVSRFRRYPIRLGRLGRLAVVMLVVVVFVLGTLASSFGARFAPPTMTSVAIAVTRVPMSTPNTPTATDLIVVIPTKVPPTPIPNQATTEAAPPTETPVAPTIVTTVPPTFTSTVTSLPTAIPPSPVTLLPPTLTSTVTPLPPTLTSTPTPQPPTPTLTIAPTLTSTVTPLPTFTPTWTAIDTVTPTRIPLPTHTPTQLPSPTPRPLIVLVNDMHDAVSTSDTNCKKYVERYGEFFELIVDPTNTEIDKTNLLNDDGSPRSALTNVYYACLKAGPDSSAVRLHSDHLSDLQNAETRLKDALRALQGS